MGTQAKPPVPSPMNTVNASTSVAVALLSHPSPVRDSLKLAFETALAGKGSVEVLERSPDDSTLSNTSVLACCPSSEDSWTLESLVDQVSRAKSSDGTDSVVLFDFRNPDGDMAETWGAVDDVVMGGVSASGLRLIPGAALFSGQVSTENNGGFVSVRTRSFAEPVDLSSCDGIELRVQGDGQRYKVIEIGRAHV